MTARASDFDLLRVRNAIAFAAIGAEDGDWDYEVGEAMVLEYLTAHDI